MASMRTSKRGLAELAGHEGIVTAPYRDSVGIWTFGIGHTHSAGSPNPKTLPRGEQQPLEIVFEIFARDVRKFEDRVNQAVKAPLKQHQFDALVSFDFNTGGIHRANLAKKLNATPPDFAGAAAGFDGWHRPPEIIGRRNAEKRLFRDGVYANDGKATVYPGDAGGHVLRNKSERVDVLAVLGEGGSAPPVQPDDPGVSAPQWRHQGALARVLRALLAFLSSLFTRRN